MHNRQGIHPGVKLRHLRAFLDIAAAGGLSAAARGQGITQPALSRTLAELEALLGAALFRREGRRLVLTEAGALFRQHAGMALQALEAGAAALRPGGPGGTIRVGVLPTAAPRLVPHVALRLRDLAPDILLTVATGPHPYLMGLLREGGLDLVLGRMPAAAEMAGLSFEHLWEEEIVLVARAGHPLAAAQAETALRTCPVVLPPAGAAIRRTVDDYLASLGMAGLRPMLETVAPPVGRGVVLGSDAVWFISRGVVAEDLEAGAMVPLAAAARFLWGSVGLTRRRGPAALPGLDLLAEVTRAAAAAGLWRGGVSPPR